MNKILVVFLLLTTLVWHTAQSQSRRSLKAYEFFDAGEFHRAIDEFKAADKRITDRREKIDIIYYLGECYRLTNNHAQARVWYKKAVDRNYENPLAFLYYADALRMSGDYEEAKKQYEAYKELVPGDRRADNGILSCDLAQEWMRYPTGYEVEEMRFFNSKANDYSPAFASEDYRTVYFTSSRDESKGKAQHGATGQGFSDIYMSEMDRKGKWSTPMALPEPVNSEAEEGAVSLSFDKQTMYFTRCGFSKRKTMGCEIYASPLSGDKWGKPELIEIGTDSIVVAHPAISPNDLTLYFVSDMEGSTKTPEGTNSKDIWMVTRTDKNGKWGTPINLGEPINTPGDEVFPYAHADGALYFSSTGHPGMGGLDIFKASNDDAGRWQVENMKYPINSSVDDFGIIFEREQEAGFFSSTRRGRGIDNIYSFLLPPLRFSISGIVKNEKTNENIPEAIVKSIGSDGVTLEVTTQNDGTFRFNLNQSTDYVFIASKDERFLRGRARESTKGLSQSTELRTEIFLTPIDQPIEVENIFFDLDKADLRPESMISLDNLVETLRENANITIELGSHTDARASEEYNLDLSRRRAQSVVNYLIQKGINTNRLVAKGYGKGTPKVVDKKDNDLYPFLPIGTHLTEEFIFSLPNDDQKEMAHFLNRRTEFKVLRTDFK